MSIEAAVRVFQAGTRNSSLLRVPSGPDEVDKKQDDHQSASGFELLEKAGQDIPKNETF
jgi:hypothetical protein